VEDESDDDQPEEDADTAVTEEEVENVGEHEGVSDATQNVVGATTAPAEEPAASKAATTAEEPAASKAATTAEVEGDEAGAVGRRWADDDACCTCREGNRDQ